MYQPSTWRVGTGELQDKTKWGEMIGVTIDNFILQSKHAFGNCGQPVCVNCTRSLLLGQGNRFGIRAANTLIKTQTAQRERRGGQGRERVWTTSGHMHDIQYT